MADSPDELIRSVWREVVSSDDADAAVARLQSHIKKLAPDALTLFKVTSSTDIIREMENVALANDLGSDALTIALTPLLNSPAFQSIDSANYPACGRAFLFWIWDQCELKSSGLYSDKVAGAFAALWSRIDKILLPDATEEDRRKNGYFNRRAPGSLVGVESWEDLTTVQEKADRPDAREDVQWEKPSSPPTCAASP